MNLKIGGSNVGKIMYGGQEFGNQKLEPGTILYLTEGSIEGIENVHLLSTTKKWENINGLRFKLYRYDFQGDPTEFDISGDDFKNLDIEKKHSMPYDATITISRSIVDGEYRLNFSTDKFDYIFVIRAI